MRILQGLIWIMVMEDFFAVFLEKKNQKRIFYYALWVLYFIYQIIVMDKIQGAIGNLSFNFIFLLFLAIILYIGSLKIKVITALLAMSLVGMAEVIMAIVAIAVQGSLDADNRLYGILSKILFWLIIRLISYVTKSKIRESGNKIHLIVLGVFCCFNVLWEFIIIEMDLRIDSLAIHNWTLALSIVLLVLDIVSFKVYYIIAEQWEVKRENEHYINQIELCNRQIEERKAVINDIRRTKHDMKNQMLYLQCLIKEEPEKAQEFLKQYIDNNIEVGKEISTSGNIAIDSLINNKCALALEKGIKTDVHVEIPAELPYQAADLCIIIGNLLDNAIEAAEKVTEDPYIDLSVRYIKECLMVSVKNNYTGEIRKDRNGNYITHKKDTENHAIGLRSVQKCVDKNQGKIKITVDPKCFKVDVML